MVNTQLEFSWKTFRILVLISFLAKLIEWAFQTDGFQTLTRFGGSFFSAQVAYQLFTMLLLVYVLYVIFLRYGATQYQLLFIPGIYYLIKEVYNAIFVLGRVIPLALTIEPLAFVGLAFLINAIWLKWE